MYSSLDCVGRGGLLCFMHVCTHVNCQSICECSACAYSGHLYAYAMLWEYEYICMCMLWNSTYICEHYDRVRLWVCMHICIYVCVYICMYIYIYIYRVWLSACIYVHMYVCMWTLVMKVSMSYDTCMHIHDYQIMRYVCLYIYVHIYAGTATANAVRFWPIFVYACICRFVHVCDVCVIYIYI